MNIFGRLKRTLLIFMFMIILLLFSPMNCTEVSSNKINPAITTISYNKPLPDYPNRTDIWEPVEQNYVQKSTPPNDSKKTYMDADCITARGSKAYQLKSQYILDYSTGIWTVDGCYCVAVGSYYTRKIGTKFTIVLTNGRFIPCILADCKQNGHTDSTGRQNPNGSVVEFIVNTSSLSSTARNMGDCSYCTSYWDCDIDYILMEDDNKNDQNTGL